MNKNSRVYIAGHTGFLGSALTLALREAGYNNLIFRTHQELDLTRQADVDRFFCFEKPEFVFLLAARVGGIKSNQRYPADFICRNISIQTNVMAAAHKYKVKKLLFPGSSCMYPKNCSQPIKEEYLLTGPLENTSEPFAVAKISGIKMCQAYNRQHGTRFMSFVPATVYGPGDHFQDDGHVVSGLVSRIYQAKKYGKKAVTVWGSGRTKREFIHIDDIVSAMIFLMKRRSEYQLVNIGTASDISIKKLASTISSVIGFSGELLFDTTQPDGNPRRLLDLTRIEKMGWKYFTSLKEGLTGTCAWYQQYASSSNDGQKVQDQGKRGIRK